MGCDAGDLGEEKLGYGHGIVSRESEGAVCRPKKKLSPATTRMERSVKGLERGEVGELGFGESRL